MRDGYLKACGGSEGIYYYVPYSHRLHISLHSPPLPREIYVFVMSLLVNYYESDLFTLIQF